MSSATRFSPARSTPRHVVWSAAAAFCVLASRPACASLPGDLDREFGDAGKVTADFGGPAGARAVAIQPDGKIVTAGFANVGGKTIFALARFMRDGAPDRSFGTDGKVTTEFAGLDEARAVAIQPDGKILAAGFASAGGDSDFAVARYLPDGTLDKTFGHDGKVTTDFGGLEDAEAVLLLPDGKVVAAGSVDVQGRMDFALARYGVDGRLDATFGTGGKVTTDFGGLDVARALAVQTDGAIVAAGSTDHSSHEDFALARYLPDGKLDGTFGRGGRMTTDLGGQDVAQAVAIQSDGRIVVGGTTDQAGLEDFAVARYSRSGILDPTFGKAGVVITDFGGVDDLQALCLQSDGKILAAGSATMGAHGDFGLVRYNSDGTPDATFGRGGKVTTDFGAADVARALAIAPDGRIVAAGATGIGGRERFALARYVAR